MQYESISLLEQQKKFETATFQNVSSQPAVHSRNVRRKSQDAMRPNHMLRKVPIEMPKLGSKGFPIGRNQVPIGMPFNAGNAKKPPKKKVITCDMA